MVPLFWARETIIKEARDVNFQVQSLNSGVRANQKREIAEIFDSTNPQLLGAHRCQNTAISIFVVENVFPLFWPQETIMKRPRDFNFQG